MSFIFELDKPNLGQFKLLLIIKLKVRITKYKCNFDLLNFFFEGTISLIFL